MFTIYQAINKINGKSYIGFTSETLKDRQRGHRFAMKSNNRLPLYRAMRRDGWDSFSWKILAESVDKVHTQQILEPLYIQEFNTKRPNGYNMTDGGEGGAGISPSISTRKKIADKLRGIPRTEELKRILHEKMKGRKPSALCIQCGIESRIGTTHTNEHKQKIAESVRKAKSKSWIVVLPSGEEKEVLNLAEFCRLNKISHGNLHSRGSTKGYTLKCQLI